MSFVPSEYQQRVADFIQNTVRSLIVIAVAGSGKTTTIVWVANMLSKHLRIVFCAFNKSIATELGARLPEHVMSATIHSICFKALMRAKGRVRVEGRKYWGIARDLMDEPQMERYARPAINLIGKAMQHGLVPRVVGDIAPGGLLEDTDEVWFDLAAHYDIELPGNGEAIEVIEWARKLMTVGISETKQRGINFDEMLYLPVVLDLPFFRNDVVCVDEAQDISPIQLAALKRMLGPKGRLIAVGDPAQAIYGFRGAAHDSLDQIKKAFDAEVLPLTISYRCPKAIVRLAQTFVDHIEAHEDAPEGKHEMLASFTAESFEDTDMVLCRNNAPLVDLAYRLISDGRGVRILGKEIGEGLVKLIEKQRAKGIEALRDKLDGFEAREIAKLQEKNKEEQIERLQDKLSCVRLFIDNLPETQRTIPELIRRIEALFKTEREGAALLTLCSVHKAKGLEADRVFILDRESLMPSKRAQQEWEQQQELNLCYVAVTRAKRELYDINLDTYCRQARS